MATTALRSQLSPQEQRLAAALDALARAGERVGQQHFGGLHLADLARGSSLGLAQAIALTRARLLDDWANARSSSERAQLVSIAEHIVGKLARRNSLYWSTSEVLDEISETDAAITAIGRDVYTHYCRTFQDEQERAESAFRARTGREATSADDYRQIYVAMNAGPLDQEQRCFGGQLVKEWRAFMVEWDTFKGRHKSWYSRVWDAGDRSVRFRQRAIEWRARFEKEGLTLTSPAPSLPQFDALPWGKVTGVLALVAAIAILPPLVGALSKKG